MTSKSMTGILCTTHKLRNGWRFSRRDLERLADQMQSAIGTPNALMHREHRADLPPVARVTRVWVAECEPVDEQQQEGMQDWAVHFEAEVLDDLPENEIEEIVRVGSSLSISFFSRGAANFDPNLGKPDMFIGISPDLDITLRDTLVHFSREFDDFDIEVRVYHKHALVEVPTLLLAFGKTMLDALAGVLIGKLVDEIFETAKRSGAAQVEIDAKTCSGDVKSYIPVSSNDKITKDSIMDSVTKIQQKHVLKKPGHIGITYDQQGNHQIHENISGINLDLKI